MKTQAHTPGPWTMGEITFGFAIKINGPHNEVIAEVIYNDSAGARKANAALIAAAPDLLAALQACDKAFVSWQLGQIPGRPEDILALITQARAAIAKAQPGKEQVQK